MKFPNGRSSLLCLVFLIVSLSCAEAATENVLYPFNAAPGGAVPVAGLIADAAGNLYGTASFGHNLGVVFELSLGKNGKWTETVLYTFQGNPYGSYQLGPVDGAYPEGTLVFDSAGNLYGTTSAGGFYNDGTVFELTPTAKGWKETILYYFGADGFYAPTGGLTIDHAGNLYGSVSGGNPDNYNGCYSHNHGRFGCGAVFELSPDGNGTWTESNIYIFQGSSDGSTPRSTLVLDGKGNLYGTTEYGGLSSGSCSGSYLSGCGTVFELSPNGGGSWSENILYSFAGQGDGANPIGSLALDPKGNLYGTTYGVYAGFGSVFKLSHGSWNETTLYTFNSKENGRHPNGGVVIDSAGNLYGTTEYGGSGSCLDLCGTVYELTPDQHAWTEKVLYEFAGKQDGSHPAGNLLFDSQGDLYMTTSSGGHGGCYQGCGSVFELTPQSGGNWSGSAIYDFPFHDDGGFSYAGLISDSSGNLYGTTEYGGDLRCNYPVGCGTVFELIPSVSGQWKVKVLHKFNGGEGGGFPVAGLVADSSGNLYGTTQGGGFTGCSSSTGQCGTVFELSPSSDGSWNERILYDFGGSSDGFGPAAGLILDQAGNLYGTTELGGGGPECNQGCGTVFELSPRSTGGWKKQILYNFGSQQNDGVSPVSALVFDSKGNLYGTTFEGGLEYVSVGTVFQLAPQSNGSWTETVLYSFTDGYDGAYPQAGLVVDQQGALYGTTYQGGEYEGGVVFKLSAGSGGSWNEDVIHHFIGVNGDGAYPQAGVVFDNAGNLYGTTTIGGINGGGCGYGTGCGTVFALTPVDGRWEEKILHRFTGDRDGGEPHAGVMLDSQGNVYGTTSGGGSGAGVVFEVKP